MSISVNEAGRKGGLTILRKKGRELFSNIGRKGQAAMLAKYPGMASTWGKKGGRPKKMALNDYMGEQVEYEKG
jgi:general stress protein YciG